MTATKKLTRDVPGLFIEATLFMCLARFCRHFKRELTPDSVRRLRNIPDLTPGDFRTVRQECHYLDDSVSPALLLDALERESTAKRGLCARNRIGGFAPTVC